MPLQITAAHSSRVTKSTSRSASSPFSSNPRRKPSLTPRRKSDDGAGQSQERLEDAGLVTTLAGPDTPCSVLLLMTYIRDRMFSDVPERGSGMNSTRTAEVLNYRLNLPPIVTVAHIHSFTNSPTSIDREIAELIRSGKIRKLVIPGRNAGRAAGRDAVGDCLVLFSDWERLVRSHPDLTDGLKEKYVTLLRATQTSSIASSALTHSEAATLTSAGFLISTTASAHSSTADFFLRPSVASSGTLSSLASAGSRAAAGTLEAVGGVNALHNVGGSGGGTAISGGARAAAASGAQYNFSLPNTGPYLRLLTTARSHLVTLLGKSSRYREAPVSLLRDRWDGGVADDSTATQAKKVRGEFVGVLPGRTKKWRTFWGLRFEWVLEEAVGMGLVEAFQTGSVGLGVRVP
ncbi:hypothetical protein W97_04171 [Coniosporium apollinis CBS 100218]|uniref:Serine-threonine protein kinase 19 n=1 Tax=Coniosporium apollinis (strain CBS 100218) TaxID=1168221 RepID=R7YSN0_CONA1|nr:uncharacterized protein W97_04171 [Coniosporium apollinis CBS 100218]EON64937.1 hypothetical protein W97_04171 [Coniosporium apollinis CBS 100218]